MATLRQMPPGVSLPDAKDEAPGEAPERDPENTQVYRPVSRRAAGTRGAPLELMIIKRRGSSHTDGGVTWVALEIWTLNRIYLVDGKMRCIGVVDRATNRRDEEHSLIGAMLTGGQRHGVARMEIAQPLPLPGMNALFRHPPKPRGTHPFGETSVVERVILRLGVTTLDIEDADAAGFHELTARFFLGDR